MSLNCPQCGAQLDLNLSPKSGLKVASNGPVEPQLERVGGVFDSKTSTKKNRFNYTNPLFLAFWQAYPRRVGKAAAYRKWAQIEPQVGAQKLIEAASKFASVCASNGTEQRFIIYPERWLNDGHYDDELIVPLTVAEVEVFDLEKHLREQTV
jgi:hypothetical protein